MAALERPPLARHVTVPPPSARRSRFPAAVTLALAALALSSAALLAVSWGKWSDAIVDSGREWIVPDALARGNLLYRDVVFWFGPVTPYVHAAFFRLFGSSFRTLALAGALAGVAALFVLHRTLRLVTGRRSAAAWTSVAVPLLLFMPSAGGVLLGMGLRMWHAAIFALLAVTLAAARSSGPSARAPDLAAGAAAGLAGLCRSEWGIAALAGVAVATALREPGRLPLACLARSAAAFLAVFGGGVGLFMLLAGTPALLHDAPVLLWNLPAETRASAASLHPEIWARGVVQMAYGAFAWLSVFLGIEILSGSAGLRSASAVRRGIARRRLPLLGVMLALSGACAAIGGFPNDVVLCATPLLCAVAIVAAIRMPRGAHAAVLGGAGVLGVLTAYRRPFFLADGPYVAPPVLFAIVCVAGCLAAAADRREPAVRGRLSAALAGAAAALAGILFLVRGLQYRSDDRVAIAGTRGMLSAREGTARVIDAAAREVRRRTLPGEGLVVFPEGEILNFLSGRPNPIRHKLYLPGYVTAANEGEILRELARARPAAIVLWPRQLGEYGRGEFGADYGTAIRSWIAREYAEEEIGGLPGRGPVVALRITKTKAP